MSSDYASRRASPALGPAASAAPSSVSWETCAPTSADAGFPARSRARALDRRQALALGVGAALLAPSVARAQAFPSKQITLVCPWPAGGPTDIVMRAMAEVAGKALGQPIVVDNKAGATGTLGPAGMAATAKPDGYTIAQMPISTVRLPMMQRTSFRTLEDFTYIILMTGYVFGTTAKGDGPFKTWNDVVEKAKAEPGKVTYGHTGFGSSLHIGMEQMAAHSGIKLTQVPFKGEAEIFAALIGGHVDLMAAGTGRQDMIDSGRIRVLNIWTDGRSKRIPDVPSIRELGYPFSFPSPWGFAGPKGMDPAVVKVLHDAFKTALDDASVQATMEKYEMVPFYKGTADYVKFVAGQIVEERKFLEPLGLVRKE